MTTDKQRFDARKRQGGAPGSAGQRGAFAFFVLSVVALTVLWLVLTTTLPYALATTSTATALWLNPNNPVALRVRAQELSSRLRKNVNTERSGGNTPRGIDEQSDSKSERDELSNEIRKLAERIHTNDPLDSTPFRLLAQLSSKPDEIRSFSRAAVARSRRETAALYWLFNDAIDRNRYEEATTYADWLMKTKPSLIPRVANLLGKAINSSAGLSAISKTLASNPAWRSAFFRNLPGTARDPRSVLKLMLSLKRSNYPVSNAELKPFINALFQVGQTQFAYNAWLQTRAEDELKRVERLNNPGFDRTPSGLQFDWQISRSTNAIAEMSEFRARSARSLHIRFSGARAKSLAIRQVVLLSPGRYSVSGSMLGKISSKRGMRWQVVCLSPTREVLGQSDLLFGAQSDWESFQFHVNLAEGSCRAQTLQLIHDARSASEQLVQGEIWFDDLAIDHAGSSSKVVK